jgi:phosphoadenosine phosphosulfate reductase
MDWSGTSEDVTDSLPQDSESWERVNRAAEKWSAPQILRWAFQKYKTNVAVASAFGAEGVVLIDIAAQVCRTFRLFCVDTQFLFPQTYELAARLEQRYGLRIEWVYPTLSPDQQEMIHGSQLWRRSADACCNLRKTRPLARKLRELSAWVTAIRREQTSARSKAAKVAWDEKFGLVKINPIADWTTTMVWDYIRRHHLPYNSLHDSNYPSIGCTHCTRPIEPGEELRAGRWSGLRKNECGMHDSNPLDGSN